MLYYHEEKRTFPQAAGGFSFQESSPENPFLFDLLHSPPPKAGGFWWPLTSAEVDKGGGIFYYHSGLVFLENQLLSVGCPWLSLGVEPIGSFEAGTSLFLLQLLTEQRDGAPKVAHIRGHEWPPHIISLGPPGIPFLGAEVGNRSPGKAIGSVHGFMVSSF